MRRLVAIKHLADIGYGAFDNLPQGYQRPPGSFFGLSLFHIFYFFCPGGRGRSRTCSRGLAGVPLGAACSTLCPPLPGVLAPRLPLSRASLPCPPDEFGTPGESDVRLAAFALSARDGPLSGLTPSLSSLCQSFVALAGVVIHRRRVRTHAFFVVPAGVVRHVLVALVLNR